MKPRIDISTVLALACSLLAAACSSSSSTPTPASNVPTFASASFTDPTSVTNPWFPLVVGTTHAYLGEDGEDRESVVVEVLPDTRLVAGVTCRVVRDRVYEDDLLIEDTRDWFAQDDAGNVWYMGEEVDNFEYDDDGVLLGVDHEGAWEAGQDVAGIGSLAEPGVVMLATPEVGTTYSQEFYAGEAEDMGEVIALGVPVELADGTTVNCLQTRDFTPLEPGAEEYKFYAPGRGLVREEEVGGPGELEVLGTFDTTLASLPDVGAATFSDPTALTHPHFVRELGSVHAFFADDDEDPEVTIVELLEETRLVMGVECAVVRDRVFQDGLLIEDTHDWFAQDDAGNVWYFGEEVDNYEYDDDELVGIDHEGAWEAGLDVAGTGFLALPGIQIHASPVPGTAYYQEYYEGAAVDMAFVVATDVEVELEDGTVHEGCVQLLEWNPLEPGAFEHKFAAPGLGTVLEEDLGSEGRSELRGVFDTSAGALPSLAAATFGDPFVLDHPHVRLLFPSTFAYESETDEGLEEVLVEVLAATRTVAGVECAVVREREWLDGVLQEDTEDWYAQDDAGNVWYMGEASVSYEYDELGNLEGTSTDGSWEAGLDVAGTGSVAQPGYLMPATPEVARAYVQEHYPEEAEDLAVVVAIDDAIEVGGTLYTGCVRTLEWNPLDPGDLETKVYAPGVGLVFEETLGEGEPVTLVESTP